MCLLVGLQQICIIFCKFQFKFVIVKVTKEALDGLGDFKIGGQITQTVKYADDCANG